MPWQRMLQYPAAGDRVLDNGSDCDQGPLCRTVSRTRIYGWPLEPSD